MKVIHLKHSGVMVETSDHQLFFDVISDISNIVNEEKKIYFFVSHSHGDHFSEEHIINDQSHRKFIVSDDVNSKAFKNVTTMQANQSLQLDDLVIKTFESSDLGVAFTIAFEGISIFFAGDLNWWHWENSPKEAQDVEAKLYKDILKTIEPRAFDIAFVPVDPRLKDAYAWAGNYFLTQFEVKNFFPIHFANQFEWTDRFKEQSKTEALVHAIHSENDMINI